MTATIEPWLRELLRCPACRSTLLDVAGACERIQKTPIPFSWS